MRYMRSLNEWLEDDVHDRHDELRSIADRVDALHDLIQRQLSDAPRAFFAVVEIF